MEETLLAIAFLFIAFNLGIAFVLLILVGKVEKMTLQEKETPVEEEKEEQKPKTIQDILEKNKNIEILKKNYNKINKATNKHNLNEVINLETKELNDMLLDFTKRNPQEIIEILENRGV